MRPSQWGQFPPSFSGVPLRLSRPLSRVPALGSVRGGAGWLVPRPVPSLRVPAFGSVSVLCSLSRTMRVGREGPRHGNGPKAGTGSTGDGRSEHEGPASQRGGTEGGAGSRGGQMMLAAWPAAAGKAGSELPDHLLPVPFTPTARRMDPWCKSLASLSA